MGKGSGSGWGSGWGSGDYKGQFERIWIPALPFPLAILCCVCNFIFPGLGTAIAGICVFTCARNEDMGGDTKAQSCCVNCGIGFLQLLAALLCFIGWCWSCYWGIAFIMMSVEYYHNNRVEDQDGRAAVTTVVTTTSAPVIVQPGHVPFRVAQPGAQPGQNIITQQPVQPPPYPGTSQVGTNLSAPVYPEPALLRNADGSVQKVGM